MSVPPNLPTQDDLLAPLMLELGKVVYFAQLLEINLLMISSIFSHNEGRIDTTSFTKALAKHETLPLGSLAKAFQQKTKLPQDLADYIKEAVDARNRIVHGFVLRNTMKFRTSDGREELVQELREAQHTIEKRRVATEKALGGLLKLFGGDLEVLRKEAEAQVVADVVSRFTLH